MRYFTVIIALSVFGLLLTDCKKETEPPVDMGYSYFPMEEGRYVVYEVDSIAYDIPLSRLDTFHFYVKEYIDTLFTDAQGRLTARIERSYRDTPQDSWQLRDIWASNRTVTTAEKVEENVRFVKLAFPVSELQEWDGNAQNVEEETTYSYLDIAAAATIGGLSYPNTCTVLQKEVINIVTQAYAKEIYAYGVGLVYKQDDDLSLSYDVVDGQVVSEISTGRKFQMKAVEYGVE